MHAATRARLRDPGALRAAPDHRRHARRRRHLPRRCGPSRCWPASPRDMREVCPDAWLLNYTNPMAMNVTYLHARRAAAEGARPVPLRLLDGGRPVRAARRAARRGVLLRRPASTTRPGCCGGSAAARTSTRCWTSASPPTRSCAGGCASTCTAGWATTRPRPASTPASTCRGTCTTPTRSSGCASRSASTSRISEDNVAEYHRVRGELAAGEPLPIDTECHRVRTAGDPLAGDRDAADHLTPTWPTTG